MRISLAFGIAGALATANAQLRGFNYGSTFTTGAAKEQVDFEYEFNAAKNLAGTSGFTSARIYTMIQSGTTNTPISAIPAAIATETTLLLGLWASAGQSSFNNEIAALNAAISQYGSSFTNLITGISVGSEDLYRNSPTGIENNSGAGAQPDELVNYISQVRQAISGTGASGAVVGHVDTWTAYVNASNNALISACDFLGVDAYPYFQTTMPNSIANANATFFDAYDSTVGAAQGKPVWVTETGWPVSGPVENEAVASVANAEIYWTETACSLLGNINTYWYTLQDAEPDTPSPSFGIVPAGDLATVAPLYDLTCPAGSSGAIMSSNGTKSRSSGIALTSTLTRPAMSARLSSISMTRSYPASAVSTPSTTVSVPPSTDLSGTYEYPHLIVPIDKSKPDNTLGISYQVVLNANISSLINFDFPPNVANKTCNLVFLIPNGSQQWRSHATINAPGGINVLRMATPASAAMTYTSAPGGKLVGSVSHLEAGHGYIISSGPCALGETIGYQIDSTDGLDMQFFQSISPPLGIFVTVS